MTGVWNLRDKMSCPSSVLPYGVAPHPPVSEWLDYFFFFGWFRRSFSQFGSGATASPTASTECV